MSRLAIHMGTHSHPPRKMFSRESVRVASSILRTHFGTNPTATPSRLKFVSVGSLLALLHAESVEDLSEEEVADIWESMKVLSTPQIFISLLRSVRMDSPNIGELDAIWRMQKNVSFPFVQRYQISGQGEPCDRPHVFKMSTKGWGCGLYLLQQMLPGGSLEGTWVMFDVMHRIIGPWLTFSAHVHDHNYQSLCTIFTCKLQSEDHISLEKLAVDDQRGEGEWDARHSYSWVYGRQCPGRVDGGPGRFLRW